MTWPHQKQNEYHKFIAGKVSCVIHVPDHENVRRCGGIAAISPNLGASGRWGRGEQSVSFQQKGGWT